MKKTFLGIALFVAVAQGAWAGCLNAPYTCGPATRYDVNVMEVALCSDAACSSRYVVGSGTKTFDVASGTAGSAVGSYAKVDAVPNGVYTHVRLVLHRTFVISGPATGSGCAAPANAMSISVKNDGSWDANLAAIGITWNDPPAKTQMAMIGTLPTPMVVTKGAKRPSVMVKFDTQQGLMCDGAGTYIPGLPTTTLTVY